jgi:kynurenine formamidase
LLLGSGVLIIESLANLDQIHDEKFTFIALPLNITKGSGCPARAIAVTGNLMGLMRA